MKRRSPGTLLAKASANPAVAADDPPTRTAAPVAPTTAADSMLNRAESHLEREGGSENRNATCPVSHEPVDRPHPVKGDDVGVDGLEKGGEGGGACSEPSNDCDTSVGLAVQLVERASSNRVQATHVPGGLAVDGANLVV